MHSTRNGSKTKKKTQTTQIRSLATRSNVEKLRNSRSRFSTSSHTTTHHNQPTSATHEVNHHSSMEKPHHTQSGDAHRKPTAGDSGFTATSVSAAQRDSLKMVQDYETQRATENAHRSHQPQQYTVQSKQHPVPRKGQDSIDDAVGRVEHDFHTHLFTSTSLDPDRDSIDTGMNPRQKALKCADGDERMAISEKKAQLSYELDASESFQPSFQSTADLAPFPVQADLNSGVSCPPRGAEHSVKHQNPFTTSKRSISSTPLHFTNKHLRSFTPDMMKSLHNIPTLSVARYSQQQPSAAQNAPSSNAPQSSVYRSTDTTTGHFAEHETAKNAKQASNNGATATTGHQNPQSNQPSMETQQTTHAHTVNNDLQFRQAVPLSENGLENYKAGVVFNPDIYAQGPSAASTTSTSDTTASPHQQSQHRFSTSAHQRPTLSPTDQHASTTSHPTHRHPSTPAVPTSHPIHPQRQGVPQTMRKVWRKGEPEDDEFAEVVYEQSSSPTSFSSTIRSQSHSIQRQQGPEVELCLGRDCDDLDVVVKNEFNQKEYDRQVAAEAASHQKPDFRAQYHRNPTATSNVEAPSVGATGFATAAPRHTMSKTSAASINKDIPPPPQTTQSRSFASASDQMNKGRTATTNAPNTRASTTAAANAHGESFYDTAGNWQETATGVVNRVADVANEVSSLSDTVNATAAHVKGNMKQLSEGVEKFHETISAKDFAGLGGPIGTIAKAASGLVDDGLKVAQKTSMGRNLGFDWNESIKVERQQDRAAQQQAKQDRKEQRQQAYNTSKRNINTKRTIESVSQDLHRTVDTVASKAARHADTVASMTNSTKEHLANAKNVTSEAFNVVKDASKEVMDSVRDLGDDIRCDIRKAGTTGYRSDPISSSSVSSSTPDRHIYDNTRPPYGIGAKQFFPTTSKATPVQQIAKVNKQQLDQTPAPTAKLTDTTSATTSSAELDSRDIY